MQKNAWRESWTNVPYSSLCGVQAVSDCLTWYFFELGVQNMFKGKACTKNQTNLIYALRLDRLARGALAFF